MKDKANGSPVGFVFGVIAVSAHMFQISFQVSSRCRRGKS